VLRLANQVYDLLSKKNHYAALRALDELQNVHLREVARYKLAETIERSVPATQRLIAEAVMSDLNTWLYRIRETSQFLGEVAFYHTEMRRERQKKRLESDEYLGSFKLNSAVELVADEEQEFDVLNNEEVQVDFSPLFECLHIHDNLGQMDKFRADYAATRRTQKELLIPQSINLLDDESNELSSLLEGVAGFAIVEKATMAKTENFRAQADVDELWESMCQSAITLITSSLDKVVNDEKLLKIKGVVALFIQTMDSWSYPVDSLDGLLLTLFDKYSSLLKKRFSDDFTEIVNTDDYMPMPINNSDEYAKVVNVSWYTPPDGQEDPETLTYPCILPFSQMYPLVCIDIRNFLNQIYLFSDDHFRHTTVIDKTLKESLDDLLVHKVCRSLVDRLSSQYAGQIVQILTNLDHFEQACKDLELLLVEARSSSSAAGPITLSATAEFHEAKKKAEKRLFALVNSKIDDLIDTAEYNWQAVSAPADVEDYMQELTQYLANTMSSVLLGLPEQIKQQIYFEALTHISAGLLALPLDSSQARITAYSIDQYGLDVEHLASFVESLPEKDLLLPTLDELRQTTDLMGLAAEGQGEEFFDTSKAGTRFGMVDKIRGAELLEKIQVREPGPRSPRTSKDGEEGGGLGHAKKPSVAGFAGGLAGRFEQFRGRDRS
jgi:hypothetical protein